MPLPLPAPLPTPCLTLPGVALPTLPSPLTLGVSLPVFGGDLGACCKLVSFQTPPIPISFPPNLLNPGVIGILNAQLALMQVYFDARPITCPLEPSGSDGAFVLVTP